MPQDHVHPGRTSDLNNTQERMNEVFEHALGCTGSQREEAFAALRADLSGFDFPRREEVDRELDDLASFEDVDSSEFESRLRRLQSEMLTRTSSAG
jgi:hypothetical protein